MRSAEMRIRAGGPAGTSSRQLPQEGKKVLWVEGGKADPSPLGAQDPPRWGRHVWGRHLLQDALLLGVPAWIMASGPITSWEIDGETVETVSDFILGSLEGKL